MRLGTDVVRLVSVACAWFTVGCSSEDASPVSSVAGNASRTHGQDASPGSSHPPLAALPSATLDTVPSGSQLAPPLTPDNRPAPTQSVVARDGGSSTSVQHDSEATSASAAQTPMSGVEDADASAVGSTSRDAGPSEASPEPRDVGVVSGDSDSSAAGASGSGTPSDGAAPRARGAVRIVLTNGAGSTCVDSTTGSIPTDPDVKLYLRDTVADLESFPYAADGASDTTVSCVLVDDTAESPTVSLKGEIETALGNFAVDGIFSEGRANSALVAWFDRARLTSQLVSTHCELDLLQVLPDRGRALVSFDCPDLLAVAQPQMWCRGRGTIVFDHCTTERAP